MIVTYEILNEETLPILEQLERLQLLRRVPENGTGSDKDHTTIQYAQNKLRQISENQHTLTAKPAQKGLVPLRQKSLAGSISPETARKMLSHIEQLRNEWDRI